MRETTENIKKFKKGYKESRYTSAGVGIFSLGLVTTLALLFICGYAENRNRDALNPLVANVSIRSMSIQRYRHENKEALKMNEKDTMMADRNDDHFQSSTGRYRLGPRLRQWCENTDSTALSGPAQQLDKRLLQMSSNQVSEYEMNAIMFILFNLVSVSKLPSVHCYEIHFLYIYFLFFLSPEVTHKLCFSGKPLLLFYPI